MSSVYSESIFGLNNSDHLSGLNRLINKNNVISTINIDDYIDDCRNNKDFFDLSNSPPIDTNYCDFADNPLPTQPSPSPIIESNVAQPDNQPNPYSNYNDIRLLLENNKNTITKQVDEVSIASSAGAEKKSSKIKITSEKIDEIIDNNSFVDDIKDKCEDLKYILITEIESMQEQLECENLLIKKYNVSIDTPLVQLKDIHALLRVKCDRTRFTNLGVTACVGIAQILEMIFDGKRKIGNISIDLTGWHNVVRRKAMGFRSDINACCESTLSRSTSPFTRILMELTLSAFIYGTTNAKKKQYNTVYGNYDD